MTDPVQDENTIVNDVEGNNDNPVADAPGNGEEADDVTEVNPDADPSPGPDETDPAEVVPEESGA